MFVCFCFLLRIAIEDSIARDFPSGSDSKEFTCNAGDLGSIPRLGRYPGDRNGYRLHYSCLENLTKKPWGHKQLDTTEQLTLLQYCKHSWAQGSHTDCSIFLLEILIHKSTFRSDFFFFKESSLKKYLFLAVLCLRCYLGFL